MPSAGQPREMPTPSVRATLSTLRGHEGLDERVGRLRVERQSVAQRRQLGALLQERLLQPVAASVEVLLQKKEVKESAGERIEEMLWLGLKRGQN